jgi:hypothetical protein
MRKRYLVTAALVFLTAGCAGRPGPSTESADASELANVFRAWSFDAGG